MFSRLGVSGMRMKLYMCAVFFLGVNACSIPLSEENYDFVMCSQGDNRHDMLAINYNTMMAQSRDVIISVRNCNESDSSCITFPFLISLPPAFSESPDFVEWSVDSYEFEWRRVFDDQEQYQLFASNLDRDILFRYNYEINTGIESMEIVDLSDGTVERFSRCKGSFHLNIFFN